jgi:hypothetical protein
LQPGIEARLFAIFAQRLLCQKENIKKDVLPNAAIPFKIKR